MWKTITKSRMSENNNIIVRLHQLLCTLQYFQPITMNGCTETIMFSQFKFGNAWTINSGSKSSNQTRIIPEVRYVVITMMIIVIRIRMRIRTRYDTFTLVISHLPLIPQFLPIFLHQSVEKENHEGEGN